MKKQRVTLQQFYDYCLQQGLPFAFYRLPKTKTIQVVAQTNATATLLKPNHNYSGKQGFTIAPFTNSTQSPKLLIVPHIHTTEKQLPALTFGPGKPAKENTAPVNYTTSTKTAFKQYVKAITGEIAKGRFTKVVAACTTKVKTPKSFHAAKYFKALCAKYPNAFVSLVNTGRFGIWVGASPEVLLQVNKTGFHTYSLAGTRANTLKNLSTPWGEKELEEQRIVTGYITSCFKSVTQSKGVIKGPATIKAANLLHLRTTFTYKGIAAGHWQKIAETLHPTPAVGGLPKTGAVKFITKNELSPRGYYSGYLGPVNLQGQVNLFVNLRCARILPGNLVIYTGCGITAGSDAEKEWNETRLKMQTLLKAL